MGSEGPDQIPGGQPPCSDETRFQGIATLSAQAGYRRGQDAKLAVTRPVFRGLRLGGYGLWLFSFSRFPCSDETRFQGIATS